MLAFVSSAYLAFVLCRPLGKATVGRQKSHTMNGSVLGSRVGRASVALEPNRTISPDVIPPQKTEGSYPAVKLRAENSSKLVE